jgi:hypothetical protein
MLQGNWHTNDDRTEYRLRLGSIFEAIITPRGGDSIYAGRWVALLNGQLAVETSDLDLAKGTVEMMIVRELTALADDYRRLKARAPTSSDIYPDGAWGRWKSAGG